jgi:hypothetical protein
MNSTGYSGRGFATVSESHGLPKNDREVRTLKIEAALMEFSRFLHNLDFILRAVRPAGYDFVFATIHAS